MFKDERANKAIIDRLAKKADKELSALGENGKCILAATVGVIVTHLMQLADKIGVSHNVILMSMSSALLAGAIAEPNEKADNDLEVFFKGEYEQ